MVKIELFVFLVIGVLARALQRGAFCVTADGLRNQKSRGGDKSYLFPSFRVSFPIQCSIRVSFHIRILIKVRVSAVIFGYGFRFLGQCQGYS